MATWYRKLHDALCYLCLLTLCVTSSLGLVHEVNKASLEKFLPGKLFTLTFVDSPSCSRCRILYPFYIAASQVFPHDPEIFFTRTYDKHLIQDWGVTELPAMVYHREGISNHEMMNVDVTVDDIIDEIARVLHGNFAGLTRTYCVHVDEKNYDEVVVTPKQSVMMIIHDEDNKEEYDVMEKVAYAFRKDDAILFATLDVSKHKKLRSERFKSKDTPVVMWMGSDDKSNPKRFGGVISKELLVQFVNERTGLYRHHDGAMQQEAGRISDADRIIEENIDLIMQRNPEDLKKIATDILALKQNQDDHHHDMVEYYAFVIDNIAMTDGTRVIRDMTRAIDDQLFGDEDTPTKMEETLKRRKNILNHFRQLEKAYIEERKRKTKEELERKMEEKKGKKTDKKVVVDQAVKHAHVHTEL